MTKYPLFYSLGLAFEQALKREYFRRLRLLAAQAEVTGGERLPDALARPLVEKIVGR